jgi:hypothetical protein
MSRRPDAAAGSLTGGQFATVAPNRWARCNGMFKRQRERSPIDRRRVAPCRIVSAWRAMPPWPPTVGGSHRCGPDRSSSTRSRPPRRRRRTPASAASRKEPRAASAFPARGGAATLHDRHPARIIPESDRRSARGWNRRRPTSRRAAVGDAWRPGAVCTLLQRMWCRAGKVTCAQSTSILSALRMWPRSAALTRPARLLRRSVESVRTWEILTQASRARIPGGSFQVRGYPAR